MITAVDTNVLLDVLLQDPTFALPSEETLRGASNEGALVICEIVYAELAGLFPRPGDLEVFLRETGIRLNPSRPETLWKAGELWRQFCLGRKRSQEGSRRILADFLIGAHALLQSERLLTRDKNFYRSAFSDLPVI